MPQSAPGSVLISTLWAPPGTLGVNTDTISKNKLTGSSSGGSSGGSGGAELPPVPPMGSGDGPGEGAEGIGGGAGELSGEGSGVVDFTTVGSGGVAIGVVAVPELTVGARPTAAGGEGAGELAVV